MRYLSAAAAASRYRLLLGMYNSFQILQTSWYVQQQFPDTGRLHGIYVSNCKVPAAFMVFMSCGSQRSAKFTPNLNSSNFHVHAVSTYLYVQQQLQETNIGGFIRSILIVVLNR
jgi:hypothetical protein